MENASKALIIAASILVGAMIIALMVYLFSNARQLSNTQAQKEKIREIQTFNANFEEYQSQTENIVEGNGLNKNNVEAKYKPGKYLNIVSDVVTAMNNAYDINYRMSNGYELGGLDYQMGVIVVLDLGIGENKWIVFPHKDLNQGNAFVVPDSDTILEQIENGNRTIPKPDKQRPVTDLIKEYSEVKNVIYNNKEYMIYKNYFAGKTYISDQTGRINKVTFSLVKNSWNNY